MTYFGGVILGPDHPAMVKMRLDRERRTDPPAREDAPRCLEGIYRRGIGGLRCVLPSDHPFEHQWGAEAEPLPPDVALWETA